MKRATELIPLSHQHHHGLVAARRVSVAAENGLPERAAHRLAEEIRRFHDTDLEPHFIAEERHLLPLMENRAEDLVERTRADHAKLRAVVAFSHGETAERFREWAALLTEHIRFEERELFEAAQEILSPDQLTDVGRMLESLETDNPMLPGTPADGV